MDKNNIEPNKLVRSSELSQLPEVQYQSHAPNLYEQIEQEEDDRIHILDYWRVLLKRRWTVLAIVFTATCLSVISSWKATPIYQATLRLQIDAEQSNVLPFQNTYDPYSVYAKSQEYLQTQFKILESQTLADRVIVAMNLEEDPRFLLTEDPTVTSRVLSWVRGMGAQVPLLGELQEDGGERGDDRDASKYSRLAGYLVANLTVAPVKNTRLVDLSFEHHDPQLGAEVVNTLAGEYIEMNFETKLESTNQSKDFLQDQIETLRSKVEEAEQELLRFSKENDIYNIGGEENVSQQKLSDLNAALTAAQSDRIQRESIWQIVKDSTPEQFPDVLRTGEMRNAELKVQDLRQEKARLSAVFKGNYPELAKVASQLAEAEQQLREESQKAIQEIGTAYRTALNREGLLKRSLQAQKTETNKINQSSIQYGILKREADTVKEIHDGLVQRVEEATVSAGLRSNNIHVLDEAEAPGGAIKPNKARNLMIALVFGVLIGVALAFFLEYLDSSVKTPEDVDRHIKLPSLGVIPALSSFMTPAQKKLLTDSTKGDAAEDNKEKVPGRPTSVELITYNDTKSLISEAYRNLRTSILLSSGKGRPPKSLLVTSSQMGEGKTTTAINIAITLAQTGDKVILLDLDMRNPRLHRALNLENNIGMSSYLSGNTDLSSLIQETDIPNLFAVTTGRIPPNPAELAGSHRMEQGIVLLEEYFDHIVIDSPPILSVTDARILATKSDGVILVVKGGETPKEAVQRTKRLLQDVHAHIIGVLLNDVNVHSADYYYYSKYYYYGYGKKYGYGYGYGVRPDGQHDSQDAV